MKKLFIILISFLLNACTTSGDGLQIKYSDGKPPVHLELTKKIVPGITTEKEIVKLFGDKYYYRLTYDPLLPKPYNNKVYKIDRILFYIETTSVNESGPGYKGFHVTGKKKLAIFLKDGIVQFFVVKEETWRNKKTIIGKYDTWPRNDPRYSGYLSATRRSGYWPGSFCDIKYYQRVATWTLPVNYTVSNDNKCEWEQMKGK